MAKVMRRFCLVRVSLLWLVCMTPPMAEAQDKPPETPIGEAPSERDAEAIFLRSRRVLLGRGEVVLDFGQFFSRSDTLQLAAVDNVVQLATHEQSVLTTVFVSRVGMFRETEVYAAAAFHHLENRLVAGAADLATSGRNLAGDLGVGLRRTLLREASGRPDIIASIDAQIPTDDNRVYVLGGGLAFVKSIDPVVLFAGSNYRHGFRRDLPDGTRLTPGNSFDVSLGYGLGLNDSIAISTAASGVFTRASFVEGVGSGRAENFSLRFALTSALARGLYIEPSVTLGLSGPGQSFTMGITLPYSF
jgi:hypothetical protein